MSSDAPSDDLHFDTTPVYKPSVRALLGLEHLLEALPRKVRTALKRDAPIVVVVETASEAWTNRIELAAKELFDVRLISASKAPSRGSVPETPVVDSAVIAISQNLGWLSPALIAAADFNVSIRAKPSVVVAVIGQVCGRRARVTAADIAGLDLLDLITAIRPGSPHACVARLRRTADMRKAVASSDRTPTLDRLIGYGSALDQMRAIAADVARARAGQLDPGALPNVLLFGKPGTGKTLLVRAFAKSTGLPFIETSVSSWFTSSDGCLGGVAKASQKFFEAASAAAPCIAFIDELDGLPDRARLDNRGRDWWTPIVVGVLLMIDQTRARRTGVVLMAATNYLERIDAALKRPGRFDRHIEITGPRDEAELAGVLRHHLGSALAGVDLEAVARLGVGATGASAEQWVRAAEETARAAARPMTISDLAAAVAPPDTRSSAELRLAALHEAAHAVIGRALGRTVRAVSIVATSGAGGFTTLQSSSPYMTRAHLETLAIATLAGRAADERWSGGAHSGAVGDLKSVTEMLLSIHSAFGLGDTLLSLGEADDGKSVVMLDDKLRAIVEADIQRLMANARKLVARHADAIHRLADVLIAQRVATPADIDCAMKPDAASKNRTTGRDAAPRMP